MKPLIKISHLYHSCVVVETDRSVMLFDAFFEPPHLTREALLEKLEMISKPVTYFVTHGHGDHFTRDIFERDFQIKTGVRYILSSDVTEMSDPEVSLLEAYTLAPHESLELEDLSIQSFGSTDQGVSYLVQDKVDNVLFFHSGDLNWWHWNSFSPEEQEQEKIDYLREITELRKTLERKNSTLDFAFVPVDPRLEEHFALAANYFLDTIPVKKLIPIHFRDHFSVTEAFKEQRKDPERVIEIPHGHYTTTV